MTAPFKAIAVDMDGTFLDDQKHFNREHFNRILKACQAQGIRFVIASGDPLLCLQRYFPDELDKLTIVAENGAQVDDNGQPLITKTMDEQLAHDMISFLVKSMHLSPVLSGVKGGYIADNADPTVIDHLSFYYPVLKRIDSWSTLPDDHFFQASFLINDEDVPAAQEHLQKEFGDELTITPSGNGSMDLTIPGINKGWALHQLMQDWNISGDELASFGDGANDVSMLKLAHYSFVMPNGGPDATVAADFTAQADNNHDGVLTTLDQYLN
jgi:Cof subfamily protein (haloacid dehalogenase superfamily)